MRFCLIPALLLSGWDGNANAGRQSLSCLWVDKHVRWMPLRRQVNSFLLLVGHTSLMLELLYMLPKGFLENLLT